MAALKDSAEARITIPPGTTARGRDDYSLYGVLRTKPGRADSPPTSCMSCSDKIASWNVLGFQGALASLLFVPLYISAIVIGDVPEPMIDTIKEDCLRAFWKRIGCIKGLLYLIFVPSFSG
jgi:tRNA-specific adenosine deaminase 1